MEVARQLESELATALEQLRYVTSELRDVDCGAAPVEELARRARKAIAGHGERMKVAFVQGQKFIVEERVGFEFLPGDRANAFLKAAQMLAAGTLGVEDKPTSGVDNPRP